MGNCGKEYGRTLKHAPIFLKLFEVGGQAELPCLNHLSLFSNILWFWMIDDFLSTWPVILCADTTAGSVRKLFRYILAIADLLPCCPVENFNPPLSQTVVHATAKNIVTACLSIKRYFLDAA